MPTTEDVLAGRFLIGGPQPINSDGGLKSFGHPIGASGLRMMYEVWLQRRGEAGERQIRRSGPETPGWRRACAIRAAV